MAARFWIGGTGNWSDPTNWSTTSGGGISGGVPTAADDVTLDTIGGFASPAAVMTVDVAANALSLTMTTWPGSVVLAAGLTVNGGNILLPTAAPTISGPGAISTRGGAAQTITFNGGTIGGGLTVGGASTDSLTFLDAARVNGTVTLNFGTLNTNGKACTFGLFASSNANTRTLTLGASAISVTGTGIAWDCTTATGLTVSASTATVTMTGAAPTFRSGAKAWTGLTLVFNGFTSTAVISGNGSFANVTVTGPASKSGALNVSSGTTTVTGTLTLNGNSLTNRLLFNGNGIPGSTVTINAATVSLSNADFSDVAGAGAAAPFTGTSLGDALGNSGITFTAPVTRFAVAAGNWSSTATWSASSGGASGASVPLPQDSVRLDAAAGAGTYTADMPRIGKDVDFTGFTRTFTHATQVTFYGAWTAAAGMTWGGAGGIVCGARSTVLFTSAGKIIPTGLTMSGPGGTLRLADDLSSGTNAAITLGATDGTIDANGKNVTFGAVQTTSNRLRAIILGSGTWTLLGSGTVWNVTPTLLTVTPGTALLDVTDASASTKTFTGGGFAYAALRYRSAGTGGLAINDGNTFGTLDVEASSARTLTLKSGQAQLVLGALTIAGAPTGTLSIAASSPGSQAGLWVAVGGTLTRAFTSLSADAVLTTGQNLAQADAITDASRAAAAGWGTGQQSGQTDGAAAPGGFYVGRTATNLFRRGQCDALGAGGAGDSGNIVSAGVARSLDAATPPPFSTQSLKLVTDGSSSGQAVKPITATGQALAAGAAVSSSVYFKGVAGLSYDVRTRIDNTDATQTDGAVTTFNATGAWQLLTPAAATVAVGKTGDTIGCRVGIAAAQTRAETFWVAHAMLESAHSTVAPYVPSSGGATSTRTGGRVQIAVPAAPTQFWWAARLVMGFAAVDAELFRTVAAWETAAGGDGFQLTWRSSAPRWKMQLSSNNVSQLANVAAAGFTNPGDSVLVVGQAFYNAGANQWTIAISVNGAAFTSVVCSVGFVPTLPELPFFDVGNIRDAQQIDSRISWFASGLGYTLTDSDAAALALLPAHDPSFAGLPVALRASVNALAPMDTAGYEVPLSIVSAPVLS